MAGKKQIAILKQQQLNELYSELEQVKRLPVNERTKELRDRIKLLILELEEMPNEHTTKCECGYCENENGYDQETDDETVKKVYGNFLNPIKIIYMRNKKAIAGVLIVAAVITLVIGIVCWKKAKKEAAV